MESCCTMNAPRTSTRAQAALQADREQSINLRQVKTRQEKELAAESKRALLREKQKQKRRGHESAEPHSTAWLRPLAFA